MTAYRRMTVACDGLDPRWKSSTCRATFEDANALTPRARRRAAAMLGWTTYGRGRNHRDLCPSCTAARKKGA